MNRELEISLHSQAMEVGTLKFSWKIKNFSKLQAEIIYYSDVSSLGPYNWKISAYLKGYNEDNYLLINLRDADLEMLSSGWNWKVKYSFTVINQFYNKPSLTTDIVERKFNGKLISKIGRGSLISLAELYDPTMGYLVEDVCIIEADVTVYECSKDEPTKEDMEEFFGDLNSVIFPKKAISPKEEAKEALIKIEEALDMVPADLNNPGRISQLTDAFDVLSLLNEASVLTKEQKTKLLSIKDNFIALPKRAVKVVEDIKLFDEKELVKKTLDKKLVRYLIEFEKAKAETVQNEQDIASLEKQIGEKKWKKNISTSKQKEMFKLSKELKAELDVLVRDWPKYEAKMKAAEEEQKVIGMEWSEIKQLVSSLNKLSK